MSLLSSLRKNKQESAPDDSAFYSRAEEDSKAVRSRGKRGAKRTGANGEPSDAARDPVLPEKKRARRRLIGAVALVLAAVIGLPMILDSEPKPLANDIAIQIPSKDRPAAETSASVAAATTTSPAPGVAASASLDPKEEIIEAAPPAAEAQARPAATVSEASTAPVAKAPKDNAVERAKPVAETAQGSPGQAVKPEPGPDDAARALALLEGRPDPKAAGKNNGKFVVQVAALASAEKVNELQVRLKNAGIPSYTQKVATASGERTRIRVGPFPNKEEAEKARARIVKLGLNGTLVPS